MTDNVTDRLTKALRELLALQKESSEPTVAFMVIHRRAVVACVLISFPAVWLIACLWRPDLVLEISVALFVYAIVWAICAWCLFWMAKLERDR